MMSVKIDCKSIRKACQTMIFLPLLLSSFASPVMSDMNIKSTKQSIGLKIEDISRSHCIRELITDQQNMSNPCENNEKENRSELLYSIDDCPNLIFSAANSLDTHMSLQLSRYHARGTIGYTPMSYLNSAKLRVSYVEEPPYIYIPKEKIQCSLRNINKTALAGIFFDAFETLADQLNFTYELVPIRDGQFGFYDNKTNTWNGAIKDIMEGFVDVSVNGFVMTPKRSKVVDLSLPVVSSHYVFLVGTRPVFSWNIFFKPLHLLTWGMLLFLGLLLACCLALVAHIGSDKAIEEFLLSKCIVFVFGAFSAVGVRRWSISPNNISARCERD